MIPVKAAPTRSRSTFSRKLVLANTSSTVSIRLGGLPLAQKIPHESLGESWYPCDTHHVLEATPRVRTAASPANPPVLSDQAGHTVARLLARREARSTEGGSPCPLLPWIS